MWGGVYVCVCVEGKGEGGGGVDQKLLAGVAGGLTGVRVCVCGGGGGRGEGGWQFSIFSVKMEQMWDTSTILSGDLPN